MQLSFYSDKTWEKKFGLVEAPENHKIGMGMADTGWFSDKLYTLLRLMKAHHSE